MSNLISLPALGRPILLVLHSHVNTVLCPRIPLVSLRNQRYELLFRIPITVQVSYSPRRLPRRLRWTVSHTSPRVGHPMLLASNPTRSESTPPRTLLAK
jgi:hypothetical protein